MPFDGSCHCGAIAFTIDDAVPTEAIICNCSHCRRKGLILAFFPVETFTLVHGEASLVTYDFNKHVIHHQFCMTCGCQPFAIGTMPDGAEMAAVNLRCVPEIDLDSLGVEMVDGASLD